MSKNNPKWLLALAALLGVAFGPKAQAIIESLLNVLGQA